MPPKKVRLFGRHRRSICLSRQSRKGFVLMPERTQLDGEGALRACVAGTDGGATSTTTRLATQ